MSEIKNSFLEVKYDWCRNCSKAFKYSQYLPNHLSNIITSEKAINEREEIARNKFLAEHHENCKENKSVENISEISNLIEQKLPEFRKNKAELEEKFVESRNLVNLGNFFENSSYYFFQTLINSTYNHFRKQLSNEIFPYTPQYIIFNGFVEAPSTNKGWVSPWIFRYKVGNDYIIRQRLQLSLNKEFKSESTNLTSQISERNFLELIKTLSHEISHCLLSDFNRVYGYDGEYSHRMEHEKLIAIVEDYLWKTKDAQLIIPLVVEFIKEKIKHIKEIVYHLEEEEKQMESPTTQKEISNRKEKREKIKENLKYLAQLQINLEKLKEKQII